MTIKNTIQADVSVIIPFQIKREEQFDHLLEAIESVLNQTVLPLEIILVDDCSDVMSDIATWDAHNRFKAKILNASNVKIEVYYTVVSGLLGVANARNLGIKNAAGKYILCLDHDDKLATTAIEKMSDELDKGKFDIIGSWYTEFWSDKITKNKPVRTQADSNSFMITYGITIASMFKKKDWENCGGFDARFHKGHEDTEFFLRMIRINNSKITIIQESLLYYRRYTKIKSRYTSLSQEDLSLLDDQMNECNIELFEKNALYLAKEATRYARLNKKNEKNYRQSKRRLKRWRAATIALSVILVISIFIN